MKYDYERYSTTLSEMIRIPTVSHSDSEPTSCVKDFHKYVKERFPLIAKNCAFIEVGGGIMACWKGTSSEAPLALMSHFDVATVEGEWTNPPFSGKIADGKIYGRGAADTKASLCAILESVEKLMAEGYVPTRDVYILSSSREEVGGKDAVLMAEYMRKNKIHPKLLVDEGGAVMDNPMAGIDGRFAMLAMSERSSAKLLLKGEDYKIARFGKAVKSKKFVRNAFPAEVEEMFKRLKPKMSPFMKLLFGNLKLNKRLLLWLMPKVSAPAGAMVAPTITVKEIKGETYCTIASTFHHNIEKLSSDVKAFAYKYGVKATLTELRKAPRPTDFNAPEVKLVEKTVLDTFKDTIPTPFIIFGGTDARHFVNRCDCVVRFAPLIMNNEIVSTVHRPNEYIFEESVHKAVEFYTNLILNFMN